MTRRTGDLLYAAVPWTLLYVLAAALSLQDIHSYDYWWHLRTGQLIAESGAVPKVDPYTYTVPGTRWVDVHWLFQLLLWGVYRLGGHAAVVVAQFALVAAVLKLLAPIDHRRGRSFVSVLALALMLLVASVRFMPRPELASFVLLAGLLRLLDRFERTGDRWIWAVIPLQILWANVHGLFAIGLAVCAVHLLAELARPLGERDARLRWDRILSLAGVTVLSTLSSLLNPNGIDGALYPIEQIQMIGPVDSRGYFGTHVSELQGGLGGVTPLFLFFFVLIVGASAASLVVNWRKLHLSEPLLWVAFLYLTLGAKRNAALFAIVVTPMIVRNWNAFCDGRALPQRLPIIGGAIASLLLALLSIDAARGSPYFRIAGFRSPGLGIEARGTAVGAVDWISRWRPSGHIAHDMRDGGYLIWRLFPEYPVMVDGRLEVFGPEVFQGLSLDGPEAFEALDAKYDFGVALTRHTAGASMKLVTYWYQHSDWHLAFVDDLATVFVRSRPGEQPPWPEVDVGAPDLFPTIDGSLGRFDETRLRTRAAFFVAVGRDDLALATVEQALALFPGLEHGEGARAFLRERLPGGPARH